MEECVVCGESVSGEYKCTHGHEVHKTCLESSTFLKRCLLCDYPVRIPKLSKVKKTLAHQCKAKSKVMGKNGQPKRCRNKTHNDYCYLHITDAAETLQL
jgi:hypothetical protein